MRHVGGSNEGRIQFQSWTYHLLQPAIEDSPEYGRVNCKPFTSQHRYKYSPHCSLYISCGTDTMNLLNRKEFLLFVIIFNILMTLLFDSEVLL